MKKFVVRLADGSEQHLLRSVYDSKNEAVDEIVDYVVRNNTGLSMDDARRMSPYDFKVVEVDVDNVGEVISGFMSASRFIGLLSHDGIMVCKRKGCCDSLSILDVDRLVRNLNPRHVDALIALNELFTIAEAWNKVDGFVPDFSDNDQQKYFPWFVYDKDVARFVPCVSMPSAYISALLGARLCFKTEERSMQFAHQFAGLFNKFMMLDGREEVSDGR